MTDFITTLKELVGKATEGPWDNQNGTIRVVINDDLCCPVFESRTPAELGKGKSYDARFADAWKQEHANAALIVHLVNHAEDIFALVEALERIRNAIGFSVVTYQSGYDAGGNYEYGEAIKLSEIQELINPLLSRLEAKP